MNPLKRSGTSPFYQFRVNGTPWAHNGLAGSAIYKCMYRSMRYANSNYTFCPISRVGVSIVLSNFFILLFFCNITPGENYQVRISLLATTKKSFTHATSNNCGLLYRLDKKKPRSREFVQVDDDYAFSTYLCFKVFFRKEEICPRAGKSNLQVLENFDPSSRFYRYA